MRRAQQNSSITLSKASQRRVASSQLPINVSSARHLFVRFGNKALEAPHAGRIIIYRHHRFDFFL